MAGLGKQIVESKFFDLDDIIASSESTSCTFEIGELNPDFFQEMVGIVKPTQNAEGYGVDTPLWLLNPDIIKTPVTVRFYESSFKNVISSQIHLPQAYSVNMQGVLNADARNVNLSRMQQQFYTNGMQLCYLTKKQNPDGALNLARCLLSTVTQRLGGIISSSANQRTKGDRFDGLEIKVFLEGKRCKDDIDRWLRQDNKSMSKKRKRNS
ncbi:hypothetical protein CRE_20810 [Caenorhabditis remanei]|uniref:DNA replication complex GINS protein PSF3 n=1 Tax=Caenorhabditis remanei TaxID=31234 RepID=E3MFN4_CAERE|nr:hypothetical protein CRE_20810 [Caenorhabditis remanei]